MKYKIVYLIFIFYYTIFSDYNNEIYISLHLQITRKFDPPLIFCFLYLYFTFLRLILNFNMSRNPKEFRGGVISFLYLARIGSRDERIKYTYEKD